MADTLPKGYEPHDVEARWRKHWIFTVVTVWKRW